MKLTFLGTSHGVPAVDRYCSCTLLQTGGSAYIIDAGAPLIDLLLRYGVALDSVRAIFCTHTHGDHINGLLPFADLANWYFKSIDCDIYLPEKGPIARIPELISIDDNGAFNSERIRFKYIDGSTVYDDGRIRVTPVPTQHLRDQGRPAFGYLIECEGRRVEFSGDLSGQLKYGDFPPVALREDIDLLICEMAHFGVEHALPYLERCHAGSVLFNHVYPLDKLEKINALSGRFGYPIRTVNDGDTVEL